MAGPSLKDTMPLYNGDAEQACLGALLIDPESINSVLKYLRPESFYEPANQEIFEALLAMHEKGQKPDLITLSEELRSRGSLERVGGSAYVASLRLFYVLRPPMSNTTQRLSRRWRRDAGLFIYPRR